MENNTKKIVIVGGGVAGKRVAGALGATQAAEVTLVEPKEYLEVPFAQLRALVEPKSFSPLIRKEYSRCVPSGVRHARERAIGLQDKTLLLESGASLDFDYLVVATGTKFNTWPYLNSSETNLAARQKETEKEGGELAKADSILIIGGGAVGVEFAGEIAYAWPDKQVTLVHGPERILNRLSVKSTTRAEKLLRKLGVNVMTNTRLSKQSNGTWKDDNNNVFTADAVYLAVGMDINSDWFNSPHIQKTKQGEIKVAADLRVIGSDCIFAIGNVNDVPEEKQGRPALMQADLTAKNLLALLDNPDAMLKPYKPKGIGFMVPIGKKSGVVQLPFAHPHFMIAMKQKDLFASIYLKESK